MADLTISDKIGGISIIDGNQYARVDLTTGTLNTIEYEHHEVHAGAFYSATRVVDLSGTAVDRVIIATGNVAPKYVHLVPYIITESEAEWRIWEGVTTDADGTAIASRNHNRVCSRTATTTITHTPTSPVTTAATLLKTFHWGSGRGVGGDGRADNEFVFKANTKYMLEVENFTANANYITIDLEWYEHTDKVAVTLIK